MSLRDLSYILPDGWAVDGAERIESGYGVELVQVRVYNAARKHVVYVNMLETDLEDHEGRARAAEKIAETVNRMMH